MKWFVGILLVLVLLIGFAFYKVKTLSIDDLISFRNWTRPIPTCGSDEVQQMIDGGLVGDMQKNNPELDIMSIYPAGEHSFDEDKEIRVCKIVVGIRDMEPAQGLLKIEWADLGRTLLHLSVESVGGAENANQKRKTKEEIAAEIRALTMQPKKTTEEKPIKKQ